MPQILTRIYSSKQEKVAKYVKELLNLVTIIKKNKRISRGNVHG